MHKKQNLPSKLCTVCGRPFTWRKKWEKVWEEVKAYAFTVDLLVTAMLYTTSPNPILLIASAIL